MHTKSIGSILMILGTTVGAAMLALPVVTAESNFTMTLILLFICWSIMTIGAFSLLEVNFWLPDTTNMVSMAEKTLGVAGKSFTWIIYLLLLYSLICAYLSGISDILQGLLKNIHIDISRTNATLISLAIFGSVVYKGIGTVDVINRSFMTFKILAYLLVIVLISPHIQVMNVFEGHFEIHNSTVMVMLTSFGYAIILPSLRTYLGNNKSQLKKVVLIGSLIPLLMYALWILVVQALIPKFGDHGLSNMMTASNTNSLLMQSISAKINTVWLSNITNGFISICAVTSFLGVSVSLTDFIADGLKIQKQGQKGLMVYAISFLPPLLIVLLCPGIFIQALSYAGILCLLLLIILPLLMLYFGRYQLGLTHHTLLPLGKGMILSTLVIGIVLLGVNIVEVWG